MTEPRSAAGTCWGDPVRLADTAAVFRRARQRRLAETEPDQKESA